MLLFSNFYISKNPEKNKSSTKFKQHNFFFFFLINKKYFLSTKSESSGVMAAEKALPSQE